MMSNGTVQISLLEKEKVKINRIANRLRACLHGGGVLLLSCKRDQIKMRDDMDSRVTPPKRVTSPTWGPHLHVNKPTKGYTTLFAIFFKISNVSSHLLNSETYGPVLPLKTIYKITEIGRVIWLVKNLWFIIPVNPYKKASGPRAINKTGYWSANNDFRKAEKQNKLLTQPF